MKRVEIHAGAFAADAVARMRAELASSPLVGPSVLAGGFSATRGFAVVLRRDGIERLVQLVPALAPFLEASLDLPAANAFYLNLLVVPRGANVDAHEDGTLTTFVGLSRAMPLRVTVLYLAAPERGGALVLHRVIGPATKIQPVPGTLLHFRGDITHSIERVEEGERMSLVVEQYAISELARVPSCHVASEGHFERVLSSIRRSG